MDSLKDTQNSYTVQTQSHPEWPLRNELPILAFCPIPYSYHKYLNTDQYHDVLDKIYEYAKQSGIDAVLIGISGDHIKNQIPVAKQHNINVMPCANGAGGLGINCYDILCSYLNEKNIVGWLSGDEPLPYQWGDAFYNEGKDIKSSRTSYWNQLTLAYGLASNLDSSRISMFNLAAESNSSWAGSFGIPDDEYRNATLSKKLEAARAYLDNLNLLFHPLIWSYDYYPIRNKLVKDPNSDKYEAIDGSYDIEYEKFFGYLGLYQDFTQSCNSEFWTYNMCLYHKLYNNRNWDNLTCSFPAPSEGALRFETFAALLYGSKGIVYYRYGLGVSETDAINPDYNSQDPQAWKYTTSMESIQAPISCNIIKNNNTVSDITVVKSPIWYRVKNINQEIRDFQDIFLGCTIKGHRQYSSSIPTSFPHSSHLYINSIHLFRGDTKDIDDCISIISCNGYGVLLTSFTNTKNNSKVRHYVAVMNLDPFNQKEVSFILKKGILYPVNHLIQPSSKDSETLDKSLSSHNVRHEVVLKEGGIFLVYWDE